MAEPLSAVAKASRISEMTVAAVMATDLVVCEPTTPVAEAARRMHEARSSSIVVRDNGRIAGIWTEHDALGHDLTADPAFDTPISEVMSAPVETVALETTLAEAAGRFQQQNFRHYLVADADGTPHGIISRTDIVINHGVEWFMRLRSAGSVVREHLLTGTPEMTLSAAARAMHDAGSEAIVVHDGTMWGILTERDIVRFIAQRLGNVNAAELASKPLATVEEQDSLFQARNIMLERGFRHIGVVNAAGELTGLVGFGDILTSIEQGYIDELETALSERETALRESEERYRALVEQSPDAIAVHRAGKFLFVNQAGSRLLGCADPAGLIGRQLADLLCPDQEIDDPAATGNRLRILNATPTDAPVQERVRRLDGRIIDVEIAAMRITYDGLPASQLVIRDISRRKQMEDELRRLATTDQLTGAFNRLHFEFHLDQMIKEAQRYGAPLSVIMFDIDDFKGVNDAQGHETGDRVLCRLVEAVTELMRDTDILARWGGEEFTILAPETDAAGATRLAEKIRRTVEACDFGLARRLTVSCGVVQYRPGEDRSTLFRRLDRATYAAKHDGRDCVYTEP